jgi:hypothetical protein
MSDLKKRLEKLEKGVTSSSIQASTEDGQQFRLPRQSLLALTCAAFRRRYAEILGEPQPESRLDAKLDLLKRAGAITSSEPLLCVAADVLRKTHEAGNE